MAIFTGTVVADVLVGLNTEANEIIGLEGNDTLTAGSVGDIVTGGEGNDVVVGNIGNDTLVGNQGDDIITDNFNAVSNDLLQGGQGNDTLFGYRGSDTLIGGQGNDWIYGGNGSDSLQGSVGNDALFGENGRDFLLGGVGNDFLYGGSGADTLNAAGVVSVQNQGTQIDFLNGNNVDTVTGAVVADGNIDTFVLGSQEQVNYSGFGAEDIAIINDFAVGEDVVQLYSQVLLNLQDSSYSLIDSTNTLGVFVAQADTALVVNSFGSSLPPTELIAVFKNVSIEELNLNNNSQFVFV